MLITRRERRVSYSMLSRWTSLGSSPFFRGIIVSGTVYARTFLQLAATATDMNVPTRTHRQTSAPCDNG